MKKTCSLALLAAVVLLITAFPCPVSAETVSLEYPSFETEVYGINYGGTFILSMDGNRLLESGYAYGDLLRIEITGRTLSLPLVENYSEVPARSPMCRLKVSTGKPGKIYIGINLGDMAKSFGLVPDPSDGDVSTSWHDASGSPCKPVPVVISMQEKEGYLKQYQLLQVFRSNVREDYPDLTDAEYANFRPVPCIRENLIYRSSSPIDPSYNRNRGPYRHQHGGFGKGDAHTRWFCAKRILRLQHHRAGSQHGFCQSGLYERVCRRCAVPSGTRRAVPGPLQGRKGPYRDHVHDTRIPRRGIPGRRKGGLYGHLL